MCSFRKKTIGNLFQDKLMRYVIESNPSSIAYQHKNECEIDRKQLGESEIIELFIQYATYR
jgi:hypothetical protein